MRQIKIVRNILLGFEDLNADYATTAKEAFRKIEEGRFDLILVDIKLEGRVSGIDIIKSFRHKEKRPKIIVISAIPEDSLNTMLEQEAISTLVDGYLDKPSCSNPDKLMQMIKRTTIS